MPYVLKLTRKMRRSKNDEWRDDVSYHVGVYANSFVENTGDIAKARTFPTKAVAEVYARNKRLIGNIAPEKVQ